MGNFSKQVVLTFDIFQSVDIKNIQIYDICSVSSWVGLQMKLTDHTTAYHKTGYQIRYSDDGTKDYCNKIRRSSIIQSIVDHAPPVWHDNYPTTFTSHTSSETVNDLSPPSDEGYMIRLKRTYRLPLFT